MKQLLLIEDDLLLGEGLQSFFQQAGYGCNWLTHATDVASHWYQADLVILDRQLNDGDSLQHLPSWLSKKALPVIILTARTEVEDRITGLKAGARDYVLKPFDQHELLARIQAQLNPLGQVELTYGQLTIDLSSQTVKNQTNNIELKPKEFGLLVELVQNKGRVFHRDELLNKVWGFQAFPSTRTIDTHILQLRQKLPELDIESIRGIGYRLREEKHV